MGKSANGKHKADRIHDRNIRAIDAARDAGERQEDAEGAGNVVAYRGRLFTDGYTLRGESKRVFIPQKAD